jgi:acyl carrier protein
MLSLYSLINNRLNSQVNLNDDMLLIEDLHMDSLALMDLVLDIEETYDISFDDANLLFDNFDRIGDLRSVIEQLQEEKNGSN